MNTRAVIYARVSKDDTRQEGRNLEGQLRGGREYCETEGLVIVAELLEDQRGVSGLDPDPPQLRRALDMAAEGGFDVLVCREIDRFSRSLAKMHGVEDELRRYGVRIAYWLYRTPDTAEGRLMQSQLAGFAAYELEKTRQRTMRGRRQKVKAGHVLTHGKVPYGYREQIVDGKATLLPHVEEARVIALIFMLYTHGDSEVGRLTMGEIARRLEGIPSPGDVKGYRKTRRRGEWGVPTLSLILSHTAYKGLWRYAGDDDLTIEIEPIVSKETWENAQARKIENRADSRRGTRYDYLMRRRLTCGVCGAKVGGRSKRNQQGTLYLYYGCRAREWGGDCAMTTRFRADHTDTSVWNWVKFFLLDPKSLVAGLREEQATQDQANAPLRIRLDVTRDLLADNRRQYRRLLDLYLSGDFEKDILIDRKARLETMISALEKEQTSIETTLEARSISDEQIVTIEEIAAGVRGGLAVADQDFTARRHLIELLDVRGVLVIENGDKVVYASCLIGEAALSLVSTTSRIDELKALQPFSLTVRLVLP